MGWWSCTIMGGDTPYDARDEMQDACGITSEMLYPDSDDERVSDDFIHEQIRLNVPAITEIATSDDDYYPGVYRQVLGVMVMSAGCDPEDEDVKRALKIAREGAEADEWDDDERRAYVANLIEMIDNYDGTPQEPKSEGLFEVIADHIESGNKGLVNKLPS